MKITKISAEQYNTETKESKDLCMIRQYCAKAAPPKLMSGISIVAEYILELPFDYMELIVEVLRKKGKRYRVYPKQDNVVIAVQY